MVSDELMLKIENVSKVYKLGEIGGTTLKEEIQRGWAKIRKKEDPTKKIGAKNYNKGEKFKALDNISFEVKKGERIGIIGHNGAGKSTLLKLISRVTGPTEGTIYLNGRVASMLEVGTGFNPELTGRENIYMNGAILGMTKKEIDSKIENIIEFSEVRQFIDTPVKRYSSGMYVKLAFSVAAHLDSEIMIMDEVLAVGDMAFQNKCLQKMRDVSECQDKTILYVSHNMNTIRQLCDRVIVLDHGKIIFDGGTEEGISHYLGIGQLSDDFVDLSSFVRETWIKNTTVKMLQMKTNKKDGLFEQDSTLEIELTIDSIKKYDDIILSVFICCNGIYVTSMMSDPVIALTSHKTTINSVVSLDRLAPASYNLKLVLSRRNNNGLVEYLDLVDNCYFFKVIQKEGLLYNRDWSLKYNGFIVGPKVLIK